MLIDRLQPESVPLPTPAPSTSHSNSAQSLPPAEKRSEDAAIEDHVRFSEPRETTLGEIRFQKERQNSTAAAIRSTDRAAQVLGQKIDALKEPLQTIVKNFPPFSPEDKERMQLLRSYTSIRKEIDQLTLPPPPAVIAARQQVALPAPLDMGADDSQIADHVGKLDATVAALGNLRSELVAGTGTFVQDGRFLEMFSTPNGAANAGFGANLNESGAARKSAEVGQQFAESVSQGVSAQNPQFLKGLS